MVPERMVPRLKQSCSPVIRYSVKTENIYSKKNRQDWLKKKNKAKERN